MALLINHQLGIVQACLSSCVGFAPIQQLPRTFAMHALQTNSRLAPQGSIPYVPYLRAPYYVWIGQQRQLGRE